MAVMYCWTAWLYRFDEPHNQTESADGLCYRSSSLGVGTRLILRSDNGHRGETSTPRYRDLCPCMGMRGVVGESGKVLVESSEPPVFVARVVSSIRTELMPTRRVVDAVTTT